MRIITLMALVLVSVFSCKKEKPSLDLQAYYNCHNTQSPDSACIRQKLVGTWKWIQVACFWNPELRNADKTVTVKFEANGQFTQTENAQITVQGSWELEKTTSTAVTTCLPA